MSNFSSPRPEARRDPLDGRSDRFIDILLAVLLNAASDPLKLDSSSSSVTYSTGWTHEDSCIIRTDLPPREGGLHTTSNPPRCE